MLGTTSVNFASECALWTSRKQHLRRLQREFKGSSFTREDKQTRCEYISASRKQRVHPRAFTRKRNVTKIEATIAIRLCYFSIDEIDGTIKDTRRKCHISYTVYLTYYFFFAFVKFSLFFFCWKVSFRNITLYYSENSLYARL